MKNNSIQTYVDWCKLMGLNPSHVENVFRYKNLCKRMNAPKWEFKFTLPSVKVKSAIVNDYPYNQIPGLLRGCAEKGIMLQVYRINPDQTYELMYDTRPFDVVEVANDTCA